MINFVIYEQDANYVSLYENIIHRFMVVNDENYKIFKYTEYSKELSNYIKLLDSKRVFILGIRVKGKSGLDLSKEIRENSPNSTDQIIFITEYIELMVNALHNKVGILDYLSKFDDLEENLLLCLRHIYLYFNRDKALIIKQDGELRKIYYDDILCIEKDKNDSYLYICTNNERIKYNSNITSLYEILQKDIRFLQTHRGSIVNVSKIVKVDMFNSIIYFKTTKTDYLSRNNKKKLEERIKLICD